MEAQLFAMFSLLGPAKDACEKNVVNDRVEMAPPAPGVGKRVFEARNFQSYSTKKAVNRLS